MSGYAPPPRGGRLVGHAEMATTVVAGRGTTLVVFKDDAGKLWATTPGEFQGEDLFFAQPAPQPKGRAA